MPHFIRTFCFGLVLVVALLAAPVAQAGSVALAVIPTKVTGDGTPFTVSGEPSQDVTISFDISAMPAGVEPETAVLRLVPTQSASAAQFIRIFDQAQPDTSLGALNVPQSADPVTSTGTGLAALLAKGGGEVNLILKSGSARGARAFHSTGAETLSYRPRLIVKWADESPLVTAEANQLRYRGDPVDATPWILDAPSGAQLSVLYPPENQTLSVLTGPVFVNDTVVFVASDKGTARLYGVSANGALAWRYPEAGLPGAAWKYVLTDTQDRILAFSNDGNITVFEAFTGAGPGKMTAYQNALINVSKRPVISEGGLITFRKNQSAGDLGNYVYGLSPLPGLRPLWRSGATVGQSTAPVLSAPLGQQLVYVIGETSQDGTSVPALSIYDNTTGVQPVPTGFPAKSKLPNFRAFHPPVTLAAPDGRDWVYLSGYGDQSSLLEGYVDIDSGSPGHWSRPAQGGISRCVSQPVAAGTPPVLYCVQNGVLRGFDYRSGKTYCASPAPEAPYSATSNLVVDGAGHVFFWQASVGQSGMFYGFDADCKQILAQPLAGLPAKTDGIEVLELRAGSDGVFYVMGSEEVYAIRVMRADGTVAALAADTQYASASDLVVAAGASAPNDGPVAFYAAGALSMADLQVPASADVTCTARGGVSFAPGFRVEQGAAMRCRIDMAQETVQ